jgi:aminopeptidase-like protein
MQDLGKQMKALIAQLYPICRSITGDGVRETLRILSQEIPLQIREVPSGTQVFDWTIPREWNIRDAWIKDSAGARLVDFRELSLHVVSYSGPIRQRMTFEELRPHLFTLPSHPDWVPYRTSYYTDNWGFCLSENQLARFREKEAYDVCIDSSLKEGYLTYGECLVPGKEPNEFLISSHICHPALANDNLSGTAVAIELFKCLTSKTNRYSYRFLFAPGSIGAITWLALNEALLPRISHGLVLTCIGDESPVTYKRSRAGDAEIDRAFVHVLTYKSGGNKVIDFSPYGYDERQYNSPGIRLPVGCMMRAVHGTFPEYHTSADNLDFINERSLTNSLETLSEVIELIESNHTYINNRPKGEPQLGRRGLYRSPGAGETQLAMLWVLNLSDGSHSLLDIAERAKLPFTQIKQAAGALAVTDLLTVKSP